MNFSDVMINGVMIFGAGMFFIIIFSYVTYKIRIKKSRAADMKSEESVKHERVIEEEGAVVKPVSSNVNKIEMRNREKDTYSSEKRVIAERKEQRYVVMNKPRYEEKFTECEVSEVAFN